MRAPVSPAVNKKPRGRPFAKGNPGRPRGAKNKKSAHLRSLVLAEGDELVQTLIEKAKAGEPFAVRLAVEILLGTKQERLLPGLDLPTIRSPADGPRVFTAILRAVANGQISPAEGEALVNITNHTISAFESRDVENRIKQLEALVDEVKAR